MTARWWTCPTFNFEHDPEPIRFRSRETSSYVNEVDIIGRDNDLEHIVDTLLDDSYVRHDVSFLSIVGIGGLGKTALAQLVFNDQRVKSTFSLRLWTCVADQDQKQLDVKGILRMILASIGENCDPSSTLDQIQSQLRQRLAEKKYLLVLDDVWTENRTQWCEFVKYLNGSETGSWILVTTRSQKTAIVVDGIKYELSGLSEDDSWRLFEKMAFASDQSNHPDDLVNIGREIVNGCARAPLAIRVAGSLVYCQEKSKWQSVQNVGIANIRDDENDIMPILKLSFHHLESPLKSCFSYCALFPKDFQIKKEMLISLWMAQGYIVPLDDGQSIGDATEEYFSILLKRCFFQDIKKDKFGEIVSFKIHDLMHDIAQTVSRKEIYVFNTTNTRNASNINGRHLSIVGARGYVKYPVSKTHIRSYVFCDSIVMPSIPVEELIANCQRLRALDLSGNNIKSLPSSIGELLHLRYLNLSRNRFLVVLPNSITKLCNLQTLKLTLCYRLEELPKDMGRLVKLKELDIQYCDKLTYMPKGMGKMTSLERLKGWYVLGGEGRFSSWKEWFYGLEDLKTLDRLKDKLKIKIRWPEKAKNNKGFKEESWSWREGLKLCLRSMEHLNCIELDFQDHEDNEETIIRLMEELQPHPNLKELEVRRYNAGNMPGWLTPTSPPKFGTSLPAAQTLLTAVQYLQLKLIPEIIGYESQLEDLEHTIKSVTAVLRTSLSAAQTLLTALHCPQLKGIPEIMEYKSQLEDLKHTVDAVIMVLRDAEKKIELSEQTQFLIEELKDAVFEADDLLDEFVTLAEQRRILKVEGRLSEKVRSFFSGSNPFGVAYRMSRGVKKIKKKLDAIAYNKQFNFEHDSAPIRFRSRETCSMILASIGGNLDPAATLDQIQSHLRRSLAQKKYLLVLDDVWTENRTQWCELVKYLIGGGRGSWIVVTTRSQKTTTIIDGVKYELSGLSKDNSWHLFEKTAFASDQSNHPDDLVNIGREIVNGCARVPLAIRVAGSLVYGQEKSKWQSIQNVGIANIRDGDNDIMPILKLSFHHLESPLKSCFSYCALFPKDFQIRKEMLISLWMAQGYVVPLDNGQSIGDAAEEYFLILLKRCFFQNIKKDGFGEIVSFKIHDLMHDIAQSVSRKEIYAFNTTNSGNVGNINGRHLSIVGRRDFGKCPLMEALIAYFQRLRALDLSGNDIKSLSSSIGELLHLRYLDLSGNRFLEVIPNSFTKLCNLQTLKLKFCNELKEFPKDLSRLVKLRELDINFCDKMTYMPRGMGKMTSLERLKGCYKLGGEGRCSSWKEWFYGLEDLKNLNNLKKELEIKIRWPEKVENNNNNNNNVVKKDTWSWEERLNLCLRSMEHLNKIVLMFMYPCEISDQTIILRIMEELQPHPNLKELAVWDYGGMKMPSWANAASLPHLARLCLYRCMELEYLPLFPSLKVLVLNDLLALKVLGVEEISNNSDSSSSPQLQQLVPCLSWLEINDCPQLTCIMKCPRLEFLSLNYWSASNERIRIVCPNIKKVRVGSVASLNSWSMESMKSIQDLTIKHDHRMMDPSNCIQYCSNVQILSIESCGNLEAIPNWMLKLTSLRELILCRCSESLRRRCQKEPPGKDWPDIQHIPYIEIRSQSGRRTGLSAAKTLTEALQFVELIEKLNMFSYESELVDLQRTVEALTAVLHDAETKQELSQQEQCLIEQIKDAIFDADDLMDEFVTLAKQQRSVDADGNFLEKWMCGGIKDIKKKLNAIAQNNMFSFRINPAPIRNRSRGLGKTALAQLIFNDERVESAFRLRLWNCVADQDQKHFEIKGILRMILRSVDKMLDPGSTLDEIQRRLKERLEGTKHLFVFDDVWTEDRNQWCELVKYLTIGEKGSWIVVTTRSQETATIIGGLEYRLSGLSKDDSWRLFETTAFASNQPDYDFINIRQEIVDGCARVPLAIKVADIKEDESGEVESCKIHNLMHDIAQSVSRKEIYVLNTTTNVNVGNIKVRHLSIAGAREYGNYPLGKTYIRSHVFVDSMECPWFPVGTLVKNCRWLRALDLGGLELSCLPSSIAYRISRGVKKIKKKLDAIAYNKQFNFEHDPAPIRFRSRETCSYVNEVDIIGRDDDLEHIVGVFLDDSNVRNDVSFLSIVGIGGVGKTALAQLVFNDPRVTSAFPLRLWTCVADQDQKQLDVKGILRMILASIGENCDPSSTLDQIQSRLRQRLAEKKYLLILDDVWTENRTQWCEFVKYLNGSETGSWILVTTRSQKTAIVVDGIIYKLSGLSEDDSWRLFEKMAFASDQSNHPDDLVNIGREIVNGCARVPLAIRVVASLVYGQEKSKWQSVQNVGIANIRDDDNDIMPMLKLSFHHLESPLKSCFSYCALFPKDFEIDKDMLISLWMAQGYVIPLDDGQSIGDAAEEYFSILLKRCFFQDLKQVVFSKTMLFKIHDLMHDIAQSVLRKEIYAFNAKNSGNVGDVNARHLSIVDVKRDYGKCPLGKAHTRSHLFVDSIYFDRFIPVEAIIANCQRLRALDLSRNDIKSLSSSIGELLHLRYLNLSRNRFLEVLPNSITELCNLQTLKLWFCDWLEELPKDLGRLVNLKELDIEYCDKLTYMPRGMGKMTSLERLKGWYILGGEGRFSSWKEWFYGLEDLKTLNNLKGELKIKIRWPEKAKNNKGCKEESWSWREGLNFCLRSMEHLNRIELDFQQHKDNEETIIRLMEELQPHPNLKELQVRGYNAGKMLGWVTQPLSPILESFVLMIVRSWNNVPNLKQLVVEESSSSSSLNSNPDLQQSLPHLRELLIMGCLELMCTLHCPELISLHLYYCGVFHERIRIICPKVVNVHIDKSAWINWMPIECFKGITQLVINDKEMVDLPNHIQYFSTLQMLYSFNSINLKAMPNWMSKLTSLEELIVHDCSESLWRRCQRDPPGEDWPHIQHIPSIFIDPQHRYALHCTSN
ncbi:Disease resistance protein RGA2, partial [Bienertia sinuspersici]